MAVNYAITGVRTVVEGVRPALLEFPSPINGKLNRIFARISSPNANGPVIFDVNVAGVSQYPGTHPQIDAGETEVEVFPDIDVLEGQMVTIDVDAAPLGGVTGLYVLAQLQDTPTVERYVTDMYNGSLNRDPTGPELSAQLSVLGASCSAGTTLGDTKALIDLVFNSVEYTALATTDEEFVEDLYQAIFGRPSDPGGKSFWVAILGGVATRQNLQDAFNASIEHVNSRVSGWCPSTLPLTNAVKLQGRDLDSTAPAQGSMLRWNNSSSIWEVFSPSFIDVNFDFKDSCRAGTTGALPAYTGAATTLTATSNGALPAQDGVTLVVGNRLLVKDESGGNLKYNGIYVVTQVGSGAAPFILTRASDADVSAEVTAGMLTLIEEGTTLEETMWWLITNNPITLGTTGLTFAPFGGTSIPSGPAGGDLDGTYPNPVLADVGAGADTYGGGGDFIESIEVDDKGRVLAVTSAPAGGGGSERPSSTDAPIDESDLEGWWRADKMINSPLMDGGVVPMKWFDLSGKFRDMRLYQGADTSASDTKNNIPFYQATSGPNSKPCCKMQDASSNIWILPGFLSNAWAAAEILMIVKMTHNGSGSHNSIPLGAWGSGASAGVLYSDGHWYDDVGNSARPDTGDPTENLTNWFCLHYELTPVTTNGFKIRMNNTLHYQQTVAAFSWGKAPLIGNNQGNNAANFSWSELIVFSSTGHRANLLTYLNGLYSLGLS